jgi:hypothetical protein
MTFSPSWFVQSHPEETTTVTLADIPADRLSAAVNKEALSNSDRHAEAISKADSYSFQLVHPELLPTPNNNKLINHWLETHGITNPTYPDFEAALDAYKDTKLLDFDAAQLARQEKITSYRGIFSNRTFNSVDELIMAERQAAIQQVTPSTDEEIAFNNLPLEEVQATLKQLEKEERLKALVPKTQHNADVWVTAHPEYRDGSTRNARLMAKQLALNGVVETEATFDDYEKAFNQLSKSGLLNVDQKVVTRQQNEALKKEADALRNAVTPSEQELYEMPMEHLRMLADGVIR